MPRKRYFTDDDFEVGVTPSQLKRMGLERQREYVLNWFHRNFEDPANETPYNSQEGGYLYIWGGPYDAREQIGDEFMGIISEERLEEFAKEIENDGTVDWAPGRDHADHERAAEEYSAEHQEHSDFAPDIDELVSRVEAGERISLGDNFEVDRRQRLRKAAIDLTVALDNLRPPSGAISHNGPPRDDEGNPLPEEFEDEVREAARAITEQAQADQPDVLAIGRAATRLQRLKEMIAPRVGLFADEFAKKLGGATANGVVALSAIGAAALLPPLNHAIAAAAHWLLAVLAAF